MKYSTDIAIFGAGIAGLWAFNRLKTMGYDVVLFEVETIGGGQTIASQGIIHSGMKFSLAGKVNKLAKSISAMPERWRAALDGSGEINLSATKINATSQQLLIPKGFMGDLTNIITRKTFGDSMQNLPAGKWSDNIKNSGFNGSIVNMGELVLDVPSLIRSLSAPYKDSIRKITKEQAAEPFKFLNDNNITAKRIIFTSAGSNEKIAQNNANDKGLKTQARPLLQGIMKNAPFPLYAHLVGKTDKPVVSITTHEMNDGTLVWYLGGGVAERKADSDPREVYKAAQKAFASYLPTIDFSDSKWAVLSIFRIEGKSNTDSWMPDTPTIHKTDEALYCWPTKLTFAPMLCDMILDDLEKASIAPSNKTSDFSLLPEVEYAKTPWDSIKDWATWTK